MKRERRRAARKCRGRRYAELKIPRGFETQLLPLQERLPAERPSKLSYDSGVGLKNELPIGKLP